MRQKIYPDPHGVATWDPDNLGRVSVYIVNSEQYQDMTGSPPPSSPISAETYTEWGLPWFDLYDEDLGDVAAPDRLKGVRSVDDIQRARNEQLPDTRSIEVPERQIKKLTPGSDKR